MVEFDITDIKKLFTSTKLVIDEIKAYVAQRSKLTDLEISPSSIDIPGTRLYSSSVIDTKTFQQRQKKREQRRLHGPTQNNDGNCKTPTSTNDRETQSVQKPTDNETTLTAAAAIVSRDDGGQYLAASEINVGDYRIQVLNSSRVNKMDVERGLSESLREIFLTSPEKNSTNSTSVPLYSLSDIETSHEASSSDSNTSWSETDNSEDNRQDISGSFDHEVCSYSDEEVTSSILRFSSRDVSTRSRYSSSLDSSVYLNNNDSWSMYTTSDSDCSESSACSHGDLSSSVGVDDDRVTEPDLKNGEQTPLSTEINTEKTDSVHRRPDFELTGSFNNDTEEHVETENESNYHEFQHDIDFLAKCKNKMSTPEKKSPSLAMEHNSYFKDTGSRENSSVSSNSDTSKFRCDSSQTTDRSSYNSSHFVHGISPLCKANKSNDKSHTAKYVRRRIILVNRSLHNVSADEVVGKDLSAASTVFHRSTPKVRRRIIFTNGLAQSKNISVARDGGKFISPKSSYTAEKETINCILREYINDRTFETEQNGSTHSNELVLPKSAFRDETEEAVYYLITKYLENKECPW